MFDIVQKAENIRGDVDVSEVKMTTFQGRVEEWLSRVVAPRCMNECLELSAVLATDVGLQRKENQDRVSAIKINAKMLSEHPLIAIAVADGMGGMRDGGKCASLGVASFFYALILYRKLDIERRAAQAITYANDAVFRFAGGKGGTTLSAILVDHELSPVTVHIGDSRIYSFGGGSNVKRLTTDDSLAEAVGGHGRELLQYLGMGQGMLPHVSSIESGIQQLAITTDGIHYIDPDTLERILAHASGLKVASERLTAIARWCGGPDNASSAMINLQSLMSAVRGNSDSSIQLWNPFGNLTIMWARADAMLGEGRPQNVGVLEAADQNRPQSAPEPARSRVRRKSGSKKAKQSSRSKKQSEDIQLNIQVEQSTDPEESNGNSR